MHSYYLLTVIRKDRVPDPDPIGLCKPVPNPRAKIVHLVLLLKIYILNGLLDPIPFQVMQSKVLEGKTRPARAL